MVLFGLTEICRPGNPGKQSFLRSGNRRFRDLCESRIKAFQLRRPGVGLDMGMEWFLPWRCHPSKVEVRSGLGWAARRAGWSASFTSHSAVLSFCQNRKFPSSRLLGAGREVPVGRREECQKQLSFLEGAEHDRLHPEAAGQVGLGE